MSAMPSQRSFLISTLQHTQPPARSSTSPPCPTISLVSIEFRPSSLTCTAMRRPPGAASMRLSAVVLPAPSQPLRIVNGVFIFTARALRPLEQRALDDDREHHAHARTHAASVGTAVG